MNRLVKENRGQADIALLLAAGIAIVIATIAGLIIKQVFGGLQPTALEQTNAVVNTIV
jgi:uncharacterized protein (UPF0333 family)